MGVLMWLAGLDVCVILTTGKEANAASISLKQAKFRVIVFGWECVYCMNLTMFILFEDNALLAV